MALQKETRGSPKVFEPPDETWLILNKDLRVQSPSALNFSAQPLGTCCYGVRCSSVSVIEQAFSGHRRE